MQETESIPAGAKMNADPSAEVRKYEQFIL